MERKEGWIKAGCVKILWSVMVVVLCVTPCAAITVESGDTLNVGTGYPVVQILGDGVVVNSNGTLNMYPGAYVDFWITAQAGSTVNIHGGTIGTGYGVVLTGWPPATVTVYGTDFAEVDLPDPPVPIGYGAWTPSDGIGTLTGNYENGDPISLLFSCSTSAAINLVETGTPPPQPINVDIDIKPGSYPNAINLGSNGVIPVAILSDTEFDATTVSPETVTLAGAGVRVRGKGNKYLASEEDVNEDGLMDLVVKIETENLDEGQFQDGYAILTGQMTDGTEFTGSGEITIVPPE